jgi:hypothetical protein
MYKAPVQATQWIFERLNSCTDREATILAISLWHIWEARNVVRKGEKEIHPHCVVEKIMAYVEMVLQHMVFTHNPNRCDSSKPKRWSPPPGG